MARTPNARRVTLQDIARETGYSINTVSHALRNKDDISRETSAMIRRVAQEMGYMGNQIASSMRSGRTVDKLFVDGHLYSDKPPETTTPPAPMCSTLRSCSRVISCLRTV